MTFKDWFFAILGLVNFAVLLTILARVSQIKAWSVQHSLWFHRRSARGALLLLLFLICMVEGRALAYGHVNMTPLVRMHLGYAVTSFIGLLGLNFWLNGRKVQRHWHVIYACLTIVALIGADVTGVRMANLRY